MKIIINHTSMIPIYEQLIEQIKKQIHDGTLHENDILPSVRVLSKELRISALTVKKAYDLLEQEEMIVTVQGKGSFVAKINQQRLIEEQRQELENELELAIQKARQYGMRDEEIRDIFTLLMEE